VIEWDAVNTSHVGEHGLTRDDVEQALADPEREPADAYDTPTETRYAFFGRNASGRLLFVVLTPRGDGVRIVTARPADRRERRDYARRHPK
jgi:uncharacterized DUF497 family protein